MEYVSTTSIFSHPVNAFYIECCRGDFDETKLVSLTDLHPNQPFVEMDLVRWKVKNRKLHTVCFVIKTGDQYVLVDGHHTAAAKILSGKKKVRVKLYTPQ